MLHEDEVHVMPMSVFVALVNVIYGRASAMAYSLHESRTFTKTFSAEVVYFIASLYPEVYVVHTCLFICLLFPEKSTVTKIDATYENWDDYFRMFREDNSCKDVRHEYGFLKHCGLFHFI